MEIVALNDDINDEIGFDNTLYKKVVYHYVDGDYDGWGELIALNNENLLEVFDLGHCSCYGPLDNAAYETVTVQEYLSKNENTTISEKQAIVAYIKEHIESF